MKRILESLSCPTCLVNCCTHNTSNKVDKRTKNTQDDLKDNRDLTTKINNEQKKTYTEPRRVGDELTKTGDKLPLKYERSTSGGKSFISTKMFAKGASDRKKPATKSTDQPDPLRSKQQISKVKETSKVTVTVRESKKFEKADRSPPMHVKKLNVGSEDRPSEKGDKPFKYRGITKKTDVSKELVSVRKDETPKPRETSKFVFNPKGKDTLLNSKDDTFKPTDILSKDEKYVFKPTGKKYPSISDFELSKNKSQNANNSIEFLKPEKGATNSSKDKTKAQDIPTEDNLGRFVVDPETKDNKTTLNDDKYGVSKKEEPRKFVFKTKGVQDDAKAEDDSSKVEDSLKFVFKPLPKEERLKYEERVKRPEDSAKYLVKPQSNRETTNPRFDSSLPQYSKQEHDSEKPQSLIKSTLDDDTPKTNDNPPIPEPYNHDDESRKNDNDLTKMKGKTPHPRPEDNSSKEGKYKSEHEKEASKFEKLPLPKHKEESSKFEPTSKREVESSKSEDKSAGVEPSPKPEKESSKIKTSPKLKEESANYKEHPSSKPKEELSKLEPSTKPKQEPSKLEPLTKPKEEPSNLEPSSKPKKEPSKLEPSQLREESTKNAKHPCHEPKGQSFRFEPSPRHKEEPSKYERQNQESSKYEKQTSFKPREESLEHDNHNRPIPKPKEELPRAKRKSTKITEGPLKKKPLPPRAVNTTSVKSNESERPLFPCEPINYEKYTAYSVLPSTLKVMLEGPSAQPQSSLAALESTSARSSEQLQNNLTALEVMLSEPSEQSSK